MRVAVIGGTGCGGRAVVSALREGGHEVCSIARGQRRGPAPDLAFDRMAPGFTEALRSFDPEAVVDQIAYGPGALRGTLEGLRPEARYILVSSAIVYGPGRDRPYAEDEAPRPQPGLAVAKLAAEAALAGRPATRLRIGAIYGPGHAPMTPFGRDPRTVDRLLSGDPIAIPHPDGPVLQPWFSGDHARLVVDLLADPTPPRILNAAGPQTISWGDWLGAWADALGAPAPKLRRLSRGALAEEAPPHMRPFMDALLDPPRLSLQRLQSRGLAFRKVRAGTRASV